MHEIRVHFDNGDHIDTRINGDIQTIVNYYIGHQFPFLSEQGKETMATARCVEFLDESRVPWGDRRITPRRVYSLSDKFMTRHGLENRIRVEYIVHYPTGVSMHTNCAYENSMFCGY